MRLVRLPGIHHDANAHLVIGKEESWLIDAGTSWYQLLQVERMKSKIEQKNTVNKIFLSSRRFPYSGGAKFISEQFDDCSILVGDAAIPALSRGDFFQLGQTALIQTCLQLIVNLLLMVIITTLMMN